MNRNMRHLVLFLVTVTTLGCSTTKQARLNDLSFPPQLTNKAVILNATDSEYPHAMLNNAVKLPDKGGISKGLVVKFTQDVQVYRLWNGPAKKDQNGNTNRLGSWWSYDQPNGSINTYREKYEVCKSWNDLTWLVICTLKAGAVAAIGPGQSVSADTCGDKTGLEKYKPNPTEWQTYIDKPWTRPQELQCPDPNTDYEVNPADISQRKQ